MRREHDFYPTPAWATHELLKHVAVEGTVLEPCVGAGDISSVLFDADGVLDVMTNDLDRAHINAAWHEDATDPWWWSRIPNGFDWVVTNPPFSHAHQILPLAMKFARTGVAMLLRLSYLEPCEGRGAWLAANPPTSLIVLPRISFTGDGKSDSVTCAWFVWDKLACGQRLMVVNPVDSQQGSLLEATG